MSTKLTDIVYLEKDEIEKKYKEELTAFLSGDKTTQFQNAFTEVDTLLKKGRWVVMEDDYCYDNEIKACWYGLCANGKYKEFDSGIVLNKVLEYFKKSYTTKHTLDLPTKTEMEQSIVKVKAALVKHQDDGRQTVTNSEYILYKENNYTQGNDSAKGYSEGFNNQGIAIPVLRLTTENKFELSNSKVMFRWLSLGLIPKDLSTNSVYLKTLILFQQYKLEVEDFFMIKEVSLISKKITILKSMVINKLLNEDKIRADIAPYHEKILDDTQQGHWSLYKDDDSEYREPIKATLNKKLVARDPKSSIVNGTVGIDFGTKSTVVVYQKDTTQIQPMRIGTGDLSKTIAASHYENPTIMEFNDFEQFMKDYQDRDGRPYTKWEDLTISHTAYNNLLNSKSDFFNSYISELKQWAGNKDKKLKIVDKKGFVLDLPTFNEISDRDINPIEIYAYYIGLYINNLNNGIYLNYILSFPVTYEVKIRQKIIDSFYKGIKKSLPQELHNQPEEIKKLSVIQGASEPAAYAVIALQEYGFDPVDDEKVFYGVFDFGGGTTDFDFGIFREANGKKEKRYDYVIEHFGASGDKYLGGENLLELLAFEVFKNNKTVLLKNKIQFIKPPETKDFLGSEQLLSLSREAKMNTKILMEALRPFWENIEEEIENFNNGILGLNLLDVDAKVHTNFELDIDEDEMTLILKNRIEKGVDNFFNDLRRSFENRNGLNKIDKINIFLAGNSSKSWILKSLFEMETEKENNKFKREYKMENDVFEIFNPLDGGKEFDKPTGKTGVAFGLIETRKSGDILVIDYDIKEKTEIGFKYYLGESRKKKFKVVIGRDTEYDEWIEFVDAGVNRFEVFYSSQSIVTTNKTSINDNSIRKKSLKIETINDDALIYIRFVSPTEFEYVVALEDGIKKEEYLGSIEKVSL